MKTHPFKICLFIIVIFAFLGSGCSPKAWEREPDVCEAKVVELLAVSSGNYFGILGHIAVKTELGVFHFCDLNGMLVEERMDVEDFFKLYRVYEQRDIYALQLKLTEEQTRKLNLRILEIYSKPIADAPRYSLISNNCATGIHDLLVYASGAHENSASVMSVGNTIEWAMKEIPNDDFNLYPSYRHEMMFRRIANGESVTRDFFVPLTDTNTQILECWRLIYTEDLKGGAFILRPVAGLGNIAAGAAQSVKGIVLLPFGKMPDFFRGLASIGMALPELVFIPARKAGRCGPMDVVKIRIIIDRWSPGKDLEDVISDSAVQGIKCGE